MGQADDKEDFFWILQNVCFLYKKPFSLQQASQQIVAPYTKEMLEKAAGLYGFCLFSQVLHKTHLTNTSFPLLVWVTTSSANMASSEPCFGLQSACIPALILKKDEDRVLIFICGRKSPEVLSIEAFFAIYAGECYAIQAIDDGKEPQGTDSQQPTFGFRWFIPELLKYRKIWHEILAASLVIQLIALVSPLFTQAIIDKVVVHRTQSTLHVIAIGMVVFTSFASLLSWLRQYLINHTGNRVDAALGSAVFEHLVKLSPRYFQYRPTGVIAARLHGVETIREFIASAAVALILDLPFLLIFVAVMLYYSITLTFIVLAILVLIVGISLIVAPLFQVRLQKQFQIGARNQAFLTEYIAGMDTVKSLQLEPQLVSRYDGYLASYLQADFATRQLGNTYNTLANYMEQVMGLLILGIGAHTVMYAPDFTIGMLIAFQMFSGKISQPILRLVGLWQQLQQARLSIDRLGDLMNAPQELYSMVPQRDSTHAGDIRIEQLAFRYTPQQPLLYDNLSLSISEGKTVAIMGASGCGKSTLAKLLQGFYQPETGRILIGGVDIRHFSANELRSCFGVVPQETILFSGTIFDNVQMAKPHAGMEQVLQACKMAEIHDAISALPNGYQTEIGERGAGLSGGQKQRIAIARALLKQSGILIFDEATSSLDRMTEASFAKTVNALKGKVTIVFITHNIPDSLLVDDIYVLGSDGVGHVTKPVPAQAGLPVGQS